MALLGCLTLLLPRLGAAAPVIGYAYTNNGTYYNAVGAYAVGSDGSLTELPSSPFPTGGAALGGFYAADRAGIGVSGATKRLYVTNNESGTISGFNMATNGTLSALAGSPFATGLAYPESLAVNAAGTCLFVANGASSPGGVVAFPVNPDGTLGTALTTVSTAEAVDDLQLTGGGAYLAASLPGSGTLVVLGVGANCALSPLTGSPFASVPGLGGLRFNGSGTLLFGGIANASSTKVGVYSLPFNFLPLPGSPFEFAAGVNSNVVLLNPANTKLFVSNQDSSTVTVLDVAAGGALSLSSIAGNPFPVPGVRLPQWDGDGSEREGARCCWRQRAGLVHRRR